MKFKLEINCDNAAFELDMSEEVAAILREVSARISMADDDVKVRDVNGNVVGSWKFED